MSLNERQLVGVCYVVLLLLLVQVLMATLDSHPHDAFSGAWPTLFFVYLVFAFLPVRMRVAVISGVVLSVAQVACAYPWSRSQPYVDKQVRLGGLGWLFFVGCLTSKQNASASQGRICSDNFTCCHTEIEAADQTIHLTQSQFTDTGPASPSTDRITPCARVATGVPIFKSLV